MTQMMTPKPSDKWKQLGDLMDLKISLPNRPQRVQQVVRGTAGEGGKHIYQYENRNCEYECNLPPHTVGSQVPGSDVICKR